MEDAVDAIEGMRDYFDKITEELVDPEQLSGRPIRSSRRSARAYRRYETRALRAQPHRLRPPAAARLRPARAIPAPPTRDERASVRARGRVPGHQLHPGAAPLKLTEQSRNLCVVGDEDQSLYRFRGATVRNILEFPQRIPGCAQVKLTTNYRSHRAIVERYDRWMASADWSNPTGGPPFRYDKTIEADPDGEHPDYPAVIAHLGQRTQRDEAARFADLVEFLKRTRRHRGLQPGGAAPAQRAGRATAARISPRWRRRASRRSARAPAPTSRTRRCGDWSPASRCSSAGTATGAGRSTARCAEARQLRGRVPRPARRRLRRPHPLAEALQRWTGEIAALQEGEALDLRPADYFYHLLALDPFKSAVRNENTRPQPRDLLAAPEHLPELLPLHRRHAPEPRVPAVPLLQQLPAPALRRRHQRVRGPGPALPQGPRAGDDHPPGQGPRVPGGRGRQPRQAALEPQADRPRPRALLPPAAVRAARTASPCSTGCACTTSPSRGRRRCWCSPRTSRPRTTSRPSGRGFRSGPTCRRSCSPPSASRSRAHAGQEDLQLHRRPQDLRDLPAPVPVLPRVRLHALALGGDLLRPARAPDHRGDPPHRPRRQARHARRAAHPRALRPHLPLPRPSDVRPIGDRGPRSGLPPGDELLPPEPATRCGG